MQALRQLRALPWWLYGRLRGTLGRVPEVPAAAPSPWAVSKLPHGSLFSTLEDHALGRARPFSTATQPLTLCCAASG